MWFAPLAGLLAAVSCSQTASTDDGAANENGASELNMDVNLILPADRIASITDNALNGDNDAAMQLANHYHVLGRNREQTRWLVVGANRGDCHSMSLLREKAEDRRDRVNAAHWNEMLHRHDCTWARAYRQGEAKNSTADMMPLWNDQ